MMSTQHASSRISSFLLEEKKVEYPKQRRTKRRTTATENLNRSTYTKKSSSSFSFSSPSIHDTRDNFEIGYCPSTTSTMQPSLECSQLTTGRYSNRHRPPQQTRHQHQHHKQQSRLQQQSRQLPLERTHHHRQRRRHDDRLQQLARYLQAKTVPVNTTIPPMTQPEMAMPIWRMFYEHSEMIETEFRQLQKLEILTVVVQHQHQHTKKDMLDNGSDSDGNDGEEDDDDDDLEQEYKQLKRSERILQHQIEQINKRFERIMARRREYRYDLARKKKNHPSRHDGDSLSVQSLNVDSNDLLTNPLPRNDGSSFATETASILQSDKHIFDKSRQISLDQMNQPSNRTWLNKILTSTTKVKVVTASIIGTALLTNFRTRAWSHFQFRWYENSLVAKQSYHQHFHPLDVHHLGTNNKLAMIGNIVTFSERKTNATRTTNMMNTPSSNNISQLERLHLSWYCDDQNDKDDDIQSGRFIKKSLIMKDDVNPSLSMTTIRPDKTLR